MADDDLRAKAAELVKRAEEDSGFAERARSDPRAALSQAGISGGPLDELEARRRIIFSCNDFTCFSSRCPGTCFVTFCHSTYRFSEEAER